LMVVGMVVRSVSALLFVCAREWVELEVRGVAERWPIRHTQTHNCCGQDGARFLRLGHHLSGSRQQTQKSECTDCWHGIDMAAARMAPPGVAWSWRSGRSSEK
jgi:hypothetical protein